MNQKIFRKELVDEFLNRVKSDDKEFIKLYLNKDSFDFDFRQEDIINSDIPFINNDLGDQLVQTQEKHFKDNRVADFECAKILYESLDITPEQASNQQLWNYLHHSVCYRYIHKRWDRIQDPERAGIQNYIERHWLMSRTSQKHLINAPLSTLWWSIHITVDENRENQYELSKIYFGNNRYRTVSIGGNSFARHKPAIHGILEYLLENRLEPATDFGDDVAKYINLLGGTKPLSFFGKDWFKEKLYERFGRAEKYKPTLQKAAKKKEDSDENQKVNPADDVKVFRYFNLRTNGEFNTSKKRDKSFHYNTPILNKSKDGYLLLCYNENGFINRIKVKKLLSLTRGRTYKNGIYKDNSINSILHIPREAIIGIIYYKGGAKYFKAFLSDKLKENNGNVGLQGYKTMYEDYDKIEYVILPIEIKESISKLILKSFNATGKDFSKPHYKHEFAILRQYVQEEELTLF